MTDAWLEVTGGPHKGERFDLPTSGKVEIGRTAKNFRLDRDSSLSRLHAVITNELGIVKITDKDSTNGTLVNGNRIVVKELLSGDIIQLGESSLSFGKAIHPTDKTIQLSSQPQLSNIASRPKIDIPVKIDIRITDSMLAMVLSAILPLFGIIGGLYHLAKDEPSHKKFGRQMLLWTGIGFAIILACTYQLNVFSPLTNKISIPKSQPVKQPLQANILPNDAIGFIDVMSAKRGNIYSVSGRCINQMTNRSLYNIRIVIVFVDFYGRTISISHFEIPFLEPGAVESFVVKTVVRPEISGYTLEISRADDSDHTIPSE